MVRVAPPAEALRAARAWAEARGATLTPLSGGLINQSWHFRGPAGEGVLQRLHPIFGPAIHEDIEAVTARLRACGMTTPRLLRTVDGALYRDRGDDGVWRAQTFVPGRSVSRAERPAQLEEAGALLGRFHRALRELDHTFAFTRPAVHDTPAHLRRLAEVNADAGGAPELDEARALAAEILDHASRVAPLAPTPSRVLHGDPKLDNVRFDATGTRAICLVDLDTLRRGPLAHDLGDAWRSWCNRGGEDETAARVDLALLEAATRGYAAESRGLLVDGEPATFLAAWSRIALELAARFATDAFEDRYFGWDAERFPSRRAHNVVRARGQLALHRAVLDAHDEAAAIVADAFGG